MQFTLVDPVGERRSRRAQLSHAVRISQYPIDQRHTLIFHLLGFSPRHQPGKVDGPLMIAGSVRTFDVAKLALETEIDDLVDVFGLELFGIDLAVFFVRTVRVYGVEKFRKATAVSHAQTAVGAQAKNAFLLRTQILCVKITGVSRVISGTVAHKYPPPSIITNNSNSPKSGAIFGVSTAEPLQALSVNATASV